jgi:heterodisulfide reductase subunit C
MDFLHGGKMDEQGSELPPVVEEDIDPGFADVVNKMSDAESIRQCIECGTCTGVCVVQDVYPEYNIRRILTKAALGLKNEVLESEEIWMCAHCYSCISRCPRGVRPGERIADLQGMALRRYVNNQGVKHAKAYIDSILTYGKINEAKVTINSIGYQGLMAQGMFALTLIMKGKAPKYFKKGITDMDKLKPIIEEILEGKA